MNPCTSQLAQPQLAYEAIMALLREQGFQEIGGGGFGSILVSFDPRTGQDDCVVKVIKDASRCGELEREKRIYGQLSLAPAFTVVTGLSFPRPLTDSRNDSFCHFNFERIYSPCSQWGDDGYGPVRAVDEKGRYVCYNMVDEELQAVDAASVEKNARFGDLHHLYVNDPITTRFDKLSNGQGILVGVDKLIELYGSDRVQGYIRNIGAGISYMMVKLRIVIGDIELALGTTFADRVPRPFVFDFNECAVVASVNPELMALAMYHKNGKHYFPDDRNRWYPVFAAGFLGVHHENPEDQGVALKILATYNELSRGP